jgi:DNA integrity scanning protein DisA with diadenylate cyclase activity
MTAISITFHDILTILIAVKVFQECAEVLTGTTVMALVIEIVLTSIEISTRLLLVPRRISADWASAVVNIL